MDTSLNTTIQEVNISDNSKKHDHCFMRETCLKDDICPLVLSFSLLSGKRKILILWLLSNEVLRFNEILKRMPDISQKMLTKQLRSLEKDHLILRHVYPSVPIKVEYEISVLGKKIIPIMEMMHTFGASYIEEFHDEIKTNKEIIETMEICK